MKVGDSQLLRHSLSAGIFCNFFETALEKYISLLSNIFFRHFKYPLNKSL